jgi:hypothetical protein
MDFLEYPDVSCEMRGAMVKTPSDKGNEVEVHFDRFIALPHPGERQAQDDGQQARVQGQQVGIEERGERRPDRDGLVAEARGNLGNPNLYEGGQPAAICRIQGRGEWAGTEHMHAWRQMAFIRHFSFSLLR